MRIIGRQLLCGLCALALFGAAEVAAEDTCAAGSLVAGISCVDPIEDETLLAIAAMGTERDGSLPDGAQTETAIILWDELQKPPLSASGPTRVFTVTETGIRLNLGDFAGKL